MDILERIREVNRPKKYDHEITNQVVSAIFPAVVSWLEECKSYYPDVDNEIKSDLFSAIELTDDSFEIAYALRARKDWAGVDRSLVHIFDNVGTLRLQFFDKKLEKWVIDNDIVEKFGSDFKVGDEVKLFRNSIYQSGRITLINKRFATFTILLDTNVVPNIPFEFVISNLTKE